MHRKMVKVISKKADSNSRAYKRGLIISGQKPKKSKSNIDPKQDLLILVDESDEELGFKVVHFLNVILIIATLYLNALKTNLQIKD